MQDCLLGLEKELLNYRIYGYKNLGENVKRFTDAGSNFYSHQ